MKKSSGPQRVAIIIAVVAVVAASALLAVGCGSTSTADKSIPDAAAATSDATTWADTVSSDGLKDTLDGAGPFVAFVSSNAAVDEAGADALTADVQQAMIIPATDGKVPTDEDIRAGQSTDSMLEGNSIATYTGSDGKLYMNAMMVSNGPIQAKNGTIYIVDGLVTPKTP